MLGVPKSREPRALFILYLRMRRVALSNSEFPEPWEAALRTRPVEGWSQPGCTSLPGPGSAASHW